MRVPFFNEMAEEGIVRIDERKGVTIYTRAYPTNPLNKKRLAEANVALPERYIHVNPWILGVWIYEWQR